MMAERYATQNSSLVQDSKLARRLFTPNPVPQDCEVYRMATVEGGAQGYTASTGERTLGRYDGRPEVRDRCVRTASCCPGHLHRTVRCAILRPPAYLFAQVSPTILLIPRPRATSAQRLHVPTLLLHIVAVSSEHSPSCRSYTRAYSGSIQTVIYDLNVWSTHLRLVDPVRFARGIAKPHLDRLVAWKMQDLHREYADSIPERRLEHLAGVGAYTAYGRETRKKMMTSLLDAKNPGAVSFLYHIKALGWGVNSQPRRR